MAKRRKGLAAMSPEKRREIARRGNKAMRDKNKQHKFTADEAVEARRKQLETETTVGPTI